MRRQGDGRAVAGYLPRVLLATLVCTGLPGLVAGTLQAVGVVGSWLLSGLIAVLLSMAFAAAGSAWWARRPASRDIVFADLMLWGWLRRVRTERRLASARWLLGRPADPDPARQAALLERLSAALEARDPYTHGHSRRVTRHAYRIAKELGLPQEDAARIRTAAALHDVGKIETPREILNKPGQLTDEEFAVVRRHPVDGAEMVSGLGDPELGAIVRHHHERLDGAGYPDRLRGADIPLGARIIAVADTFDALTSNRPYRPGCRHKKALDVLRAEAGVQLDPDAVRAFLSYYSGRRALPWWSGVAAAPSRLTAWLLSGIQGAASAPLGGAAALGTAFLVGASLAGSPARGEPARSERAGEPLATGALSQRADASRAERRPSADGRGPGTPQDRDASTGGDHGRAPGAGRGRGGRGDGPGVQGDDPGVHDGNPGAGGDRGAGGGSRGGAPGSAGGGPGGGGNGGGLPEIPGVPDPPDEPGLPDLPEVSDLPDVPELPKVPQLPPVPELPKVPDLPAVPQVPEVPELPELPSVQLP